MESIFPPWDSLEPKDWIAIGAFIVSFISLVITLRDKKRQQHQSVISALQGQKEAVAYIALRMRHRRLPWSKKDRDEIITALCLAWILESSDRARASLLTALTEANKVRQDKVEAIRQDIDNQLEDYCGRIPLKPKSKEDVENYRMRLRQLGEALGHTVAKTGGH